jgi:hypothetical protein
MRGYRAYRRANGVAQTHGGGVSQPVIITSQDNKPSIIVTGGCVPIRRIIPYNKAIFAKCITFVCSDDQVE